MEPGGDILENDYTSTQKVRCGLLSLSCPKLSTLCPRGCWRGSHCPWLQWCVRISGRRAGQGRNPDGVPAVPASSTEQAWVLAGCGGRSAGQGDTRLVGRSHLRGAAGACAGWSTQGHLFGKFRTVLWSLKQLLLCLRQHSPVQCELE